MDDSSGFPLAYRKWLILSGLAVLLALTGLLYSQYHTHQTALQASVRPVKAIVVDVSQLKRRSRGPAYQPSSVLTTLAAPSGQTRPIGSGSRLTSAGGATTPVEAKHKATWPPAPAHASGHDTVPGTANVSARGVAAAQERRAHLAKLGAWQAAAPPSRAEISAKRQRLAKGERLYQRTIIKRKDLFADTRGGLRAVIAH